jgi:hypothetical protein
MTPHKNTTRGFANLMGIMIVTAIGIGACITLISIDTTSVDGAITAEAFAVARTNADTCTERALLSLRGSDVYEGASAYTLARGTCESTTTNVLEGDGTRTITLVSLGLANDVMLHTNTTLTISYPPPDALPTFSRVITTEVE